MSIRYILLLLIFVTGYILSYGPVCYFQVENEWDPNSNKSKIVNSIYYPVEITMGRFDFYFSYLTWWASKSSNFENIIWSDLQ